MNAGDGFLSFYRIDLAGGWTDVPPFYDGSHGLVITASLAKGVSLSARPADAFSVPAVQEEGFAGKAVKAVAHVFGDWPPVQLALDQDPVFRGGLGGSGALVAGLAAMHAQLTGKPLNPLETALAARRIEVEIMGHPGGWQDPVAALSGGLLAQKFEPAGQQFIHLPMAEEFVRSVLAGSLVIKVSEEERVSGSLIAQVQDRFLRGDSQTHQAVSDLKEAARLAIHALMNGDSKGLTEVIRANEDAQYRLLPEVDHSGYHRLKERLGGLLAAGKPLGAGGGGCYFAVFDSSEQRHQAQSLLGKDFPAFTPELAPFRVGA